MQRKTLALSLTWLALASACGGSPEPKHPDDPPPLDDPAGGVEAPSSAQVQAAIDAIQGNDFSKAKALLEKARSDDPKDPQAAFYLGVALEGLEDGAGAIEQYRQALALDPKLADASQNLAALLLDAAKEKEALEVVRAALAHTPTHPGLLLNHALALEAAGDRPGATAADGKAAAADPENLEIAYAYAELLAEAGKKEAAAQQLKKVVVTDQPNVLAAAANLLGKLGAYGDCIAALDKAIRTVGKQKASAPLHVGRGVCRHEMKDEAGAKSDYDAALALDPELAAAHYYLGMHYRAAGKKKEAIAAFEKAAKIAGDEGVGPGAKKALAELGAKK
jgi:Tfp pilus assembly protein PilF